MKILTSKLNHGKTYFVCGALALSLVAGSAQAASIFWTSTAGATDADINNTGAIVEAANFGGATVVANGVTFTGVTFPASLTNLTQNYNSNGTWTSPGLGGNIDDIFTSYSSVSTLIGESLINLVDGQMYEIQVFAYASGGPAARTLTLGDGGAPANEITVTYGDANIVTGTFTADGTSQAMNWIESTGSNIVSGYQLRNVTPIPVPEPSSTLLLGLGGLALILRRRK